MIRNLTAAIFLAGAAPAFAQADSALPDPNDRSDTVTLGVGGAWFPDYEGSDEYKGTPAAFVRGRVSGFDFFTRATWLYVDVIKRPDSGMDFDFGPIVGFRSNRAGDVKDAAVDKLPELDTAIEVGGFAGISWHGLTNPYDVLSLRVDVLTDVGGAHKSTLVTPTIDFGTPLSRTFYLGASASLEWAGGGYADYYYSITPAEGAVAGLPAYDADGGLKHWRLGLVANQSVTGDLTHGFSIFGAGGYTHLLGDFADSPIVDQRGSPSQWFAALGIAYTW
jgi:outer membrane scaffolding protein for murein synthesis (MipA/OmpV family)